MGSRRALLALATTLVPGVVRAETYFDPREDAIQRHVIARLDAELAGCFRRALDRDPGEVGGRVGLAFRVLADGRTDEIHVTEARPLLGACVQARVEAWRFGPDPDDDTTSVAFALFFEPKQASRRDTRRVRAAIARDHAAALRGCVGKADADIDDAKLAVIVRPDGAVGRVTVLPRYASFADCIERTARAWTFAPHREARRVDVALAPLVR